MLQPVLYRNADRSLILIDIPVSISAAQGTQECPTSACILSCEPLQQPYVIPNEPKSDRAKGHAQGNTVDAELHQIYRATIDDALQELREAVPGDWCLPRKTAAARRLSNSPQEPAGAGGTAGMHGGTVAQAISSLTLRHGTPDPAPPRPESVDGLLRVLCGCSALTNPSFPIYGMRAAVAHHGFTAASLEAPHRGSGADLEPWDCIYHNAKKIPMMLSVQKFADADVDSTAAHFEVPPLASFVLSDCSQPAVFHNAFRNMYEGNGLAGGFDFILLDPPWPNASARRAGAYATQMTLKDMRRLILGLDLNSLLSHNGLVGVWITNKPAVRALMLGPHGIFKQLNLKLEEEWIWLKVTSKGEPIISLDSLWRKPYEVLLLARSNQDSAFDGHPSNALRRRVIVGVPDLHSRKPCLKELVDSLRPDPSNGAVLEIFARHLVSGWWSWGNEALKFNWEGHWRSSAAQPSRVTDGS